MSDPSALLVAGFDLWPGTSTWARRASEAVRAAAGRHRVVTLSLRTGHLPHTESVDGARALRVPVGPGPLLDRVEAFARAVQRQLDADAPAAVYTADPFVGAAVLTHARPVRLVYEALHLPSPDLPLLDAGDDGGEAVADALAVWDAACLRQAALVVCPTRARLPALEDLRHGAPVAVIPPGAEPAVAPVPRWTGPLRVRHAAWSLPTAAAERLVALARALAPGTLLEVLEPPLARWSTESRAALALASRAGLLRHRAVGDEGGRGAHVELLGPLVPGRGSPGLGQALPALAAGRPLLAADGERAREELPAAASVFAPAGDVDALAAAVRTLATDGSLLASAAAEALAFVSAHHDPARVRGLLRDLDRAVGIPRADDALRSGSDPAWPSGRRAAHTRSVGSGLEGTDPGSPSGRFG